MSSLIRKGSRSPMSRNSLTSTRRTRAVWDRTATDTRLLLSSFPYPVSLGNTMNPLRMTLKTCAPSRPTFPQRLRAADARVLSRMISRSALIGVEADACSIAPQMISQAPALDAAAQVTEGALANLILTLSPSLFRQSLPLPRGACPPKADHSGLRAGVHPFNISLSSSRDDGPVALGVGAPNGAPTPLSPYTNGHAC